MRRTTNHQEIKKWAEKNGGTPDLLNTPEVGNNNQGLRINFPGREDEAFLNNSMVSKSISWNEFFQKFDEMELAFIYEENARGNLSNSYRFIKRENSE